MWPNKISLLSLISVYQSKLLRCTVSFLNATGNKLVLLNISSVCLLKMWLQGQQLLTVNSLKLQHSTKKLILKLLQSLEIGFNGFLPSRVIVFAHFSNRVNGETVFPTSRGPHEWSKFISLESAEVTSTKYRVGKSQLPVAWNAVLLCGTFETPLKPFLFLI